MANRNNDGFDIGGMRILVAGSMDFFNTALVYKAIAQAVRLHFFGDNEVSPAELESKFSFVTVVHGAAKGAESSAADFARKNGMREEAHYADWNTHGRSAGPIRNKEMVYSDPKPNICLAFIADSESRGTKNVMMMARKRGVPVMEIPDAAS